MSNPSKVEAFALRASKLLTNSSPLNGQHIANLVNSLRVKFYFLSEAALDTLSNEITSSIIATSKNLTQQSVFELQNLVIQSIRNAIFLHITDQFHSITDVTSLRKSSQQSNQDSFIVNLLRTTFTQLEKELGAIMHGFENIGWCPEGFVHPTRRGDFRLADSTAVQNGSVFVKEVASMLPPALFNLQQSTRVLDMCSAPGGKTLQLAMRMPGSASLIANEFESHRADILQRVLQAYGVSSGMITREDGSMIGRNNFSAFDAVLCDAPCSCTGNFRDNPGCADAYSPHGIQSSTKVQLTLLHSAIDATKPGGTIVYSTCSSDVLENERVVEQVLTHRSHEVRVINPRTTPAQSSHHRWNLERAMSASAAAQKHHNIAHFDALRIWPHEYDTEAFFAVVLEKKPS